MYIFVGSDEDIDFDDKYRAQTKISIKHTSNTHRGMMQKGNI